MQQSNYKRFKRDKVAYYRCSQKYLDYLDKLSKRYNISKTDILHIIVYTMSDYELVNNTNIDFYKLLIGTFKKYKKGIQL